MGTFKEEPAGDPVSTCLSLLDPEVLLVLHYIIFDCLRRAIWSREGKLHAALAA
jgi:hypothetical protein